MLCDVFRRALGSAQHGYAAVFLVGAALFVASAALALRLAAGTRPLRLPTLLREQTS